MLRYVEIAFCHWVSLGLLFLLMSLDVLESWGSQVFLKRIARFCLIRSRCIYRIRFFLTARQQRRRQRKLQLHRKSKECRMMLKPLLFFTIEPHLVPQVFMIVVHTCIDHCNNHLTRKAFVNIPGFRGIDVKVAVLM